MPSLLGRDLPCPFDCDAGRLYDVEDRPYDCPTCGGDGPEELECEGCTRRERVDVDATYEIPAGCSVLSWRCPDCVVLDELPESIWYALGLIEGLIGRHSDRKRAAQALARVVAARVGVE